MNQVDSLVKALSCPSQLEGGGPLMVEDLDVTFKLVTYWWPKVTTWAKHNRFCRQLQERGILYSVEVYEKGEGSSTNVLLYLNMFGVDVTVGDRTVHFGVFK